MFAQRLTQSKREGGVRNPVPPSPSLLLPSSASLRLLAVAATSSDSLYTRVDTADTIESNIWGFLAVSALCGTVTGSVMFLKTGNPKYVWVCAGLPVMALLAGAMRERARQEVRLPSALPKNIPLTNFIFCSNSTRKKNSLYYGLDRNNMHLVT